MKKLLVLKDDFEWNLSPGFRKTNINYQDSPQCLKYVGGVDISFIKDNLEDACASFIVLEFPSMNIVYKRFEMVKLKLPYIPTFLAFREVDHLLPLIQELKSTKPSIMPQVLLQQDLILIR